MLTTRVSTGFGTSYRKRAVRIAAAVQEMERLTQQQALKQAVRLSSGSIKTIQLRMAARERGGKGLYSVADPAPPAAPFIINAQSGGLRSSWKCDFAATETGTNVTLYNTSPHFAFMAGTSKMIARPLLQQMTVLVARKRLERLAEIKSKTLKVT